MTLYLKSSEFYLTGTKTKPLLIFVLDELHIKNKFHFLLTDLITSFKLNRFP